MWLKITQTGDDWNHGARFRETCINQSCSVPSMYLLVKDHKPINPGELPKTRPVCSGYNGMGIHFSNHLGEITDAIADCIEEKIEVISTEDFLSKAAKYNRELEQAGQRDDQQEVGKVALTGADAVGLYPNLEGRQSGRLVRDAFLKSNLTIEGLNYIEAARYVVMGYDLFEIRQMGLERVTPKRRYLKGTKPGVTGVGPLGKNSDDEFQWVFPEVEPTDLEKRKLFAACLEIGIRKAFALHLYQFGGRIYKQTDGGPIGMRLAGSVARIVMAEWGERMLKIMKDNSITVWLAACYVDDVRFLTSVLERGVRWDHQERKYVKRDDWQEEDRIENLSDEQRTARELKKAMNSIFPNIQFTTEIPEDFPDRRLPTLDCSCWLEDNSKVSGGDDWQEGDSPWRRPRIMYSFFEKEMNSPFCILEKSALPDNTKISSLSQEVVRRMLHTSELVPQEERNQVVEKFVSKLKLSGYRDDQVREIVKAGLKGYERKLGKAKNMGTSVHREAKSTVGLRFKKKLSAKTNWFKSKNKKVETTRTVREKVGNKKFSGKNGDDKRDGGKKEDKAPIAVLFVPKTPGGELAKRLKTVENDLEKMTGERVKIVERAGIMIKRILHKSNPWAGGNCGREGCLVCRFEKGGGDCKKRNVTYRTECLKCNESGKTQQYFGESARTGFERGLEHERDFHNMKEDSHMAKHWLDVHQGEEQPDFSMKIIRSHSSAFVRQIHEAVLIEMNMGTVLNSKGEYNRCQLPRLGVKMGVRDVAEKEEMEEMTEKDIFTAVVESKKRREKTEDNAQPPSKRKKFAVRKPLATPACKRTRKNDNFLPPCKKLRSSREVEKCLLPKTAQGPPSVSGKRQEKIIPTIVITAPNHESIPNNIDEIQNPSTFKCKSMNNECSKSAKRDPSKIQPRISKFLTEISVSTPRPTNFSTKKCKEKIILTPISTSKHARENTSPTVNQIINFFENNSVSKPGNDATQTSMKTEPNSDAEKFATTVTHTGTSRKKQQLKSKCKKSKLGPPTLYNYKKISQYFAVEEKVELNHN